MKVYILFFKHSCMTDILGVYSTLEKAEDILSLFAINFSGSDRGRDLVIIEKVLDDEDEK